MCGVAVLQRSSGCAPGTQASLLKAIGGRGPDQQGEHVVATGGLWMAASVLRIQGDKIAAQPFIDEQQNVLLWNGEVFAFRFEGGLGTLPRSGAGDTPFMSQELREAAGSSPVAADSGLHRLLAVVGLLSRINGPYAFAYYHRSSHQLFYGRDPFGRRSLLRRRCADAGILLCSSAADAGPWEELAVDGLRSLDLGSGEELFAPWPAEVVRLCRLQLAAVNGANWGVDARAFLDEVSASVQRRVDALAPIEDQACRIGVLFSGGIDSVFLTLLLHRCLLRVGSTERVDLLNVSFDSGSGAGAPDRLAAVVALAEIRALCPERQWKLVCVDVSDEERERHTSRIRQLIYPLDTHMDLNIGTAFWFASRGRGLVIEHGEAAVSAALTQSAGGKALVRVGAEGNNEHFPGLVAASFRQRAGRARETLRCGNELCGRPPKASCAWGLCNRCCLRGQKSGERDMGSCAAHRLFLGKLSGMNMEPVRKEELPEQAPEQQLKDQQQEEQQQHGVEYTSTCRVLLVGIGADEQMAGYGRHRTCYLVGGAAALDAELGRDLERLWRRNLGRDDRCISDNGREAWFPFLDEQVVAFLQQMPIERIADMSLPSGVGDKRVLREAARLAGLEMSAAFVKRAIQFGTRIAKSTNMQYFGSHRKGKGDSKI